MSFAAMFPFLLLALTALNPEVTACKPHMDELMKDVKGYMDGMDEMCKSGLAPKVMDCLGQYMCGHLTLECCVLLNAPEDLCPQIEHHKPETDDDNDYNLAEEEYEEIDEIFRQLGKEETTTVGRGQEYFGQGQNGRYGQNNGQQSGPNEQLDWFQSQFNYQFGDNRPTTVVPKTTPFAWPQHYGRGINPEQQPTNKRGYPTFIPNQN